MRTTIYLLMLLYFASSANAQYGDSNADRWSASIQADINNGAPSEQICNNAMSSAKASDLAQFKSWAYGVVRQYCPEKLRSVPSQSSSATNQDCSMTQAQINSAARGRRIEVVGKDCYAVFN